MKITNIHAEVDAKFGPGSYLDLRGEERLKAVEATEKSLFDGYTILDSGLSEVGYDTKTDRYTLIFKQLMTSRKFTVKATNEVAKWFIEMMNERSKATGQLAIKIENGVVTDAIRLTF